ncbi:MAG: hypothetical protein HY001_05000 [Candidatus Portnoybacteria bacterium]|nr:hypothetical protein [Candidatus Portnoybacteria bacterium]
MKPRTDHQKILKLRLQGKTYGEIRKHFEVPKSTLSSWLKDITLPGNAKHILERKHGNGLKALAKFNTQRTLKIRKENEDIRKEFEKVVQVLSKREIMLIGASLYWAEGYKNFGARKKGYPYVSFSNSDPKMILFFIAFLKNIIGVEKDMIKADIFLHSLVNAEKSLAYWQSITRLPKINFYFHKAISKASGGKRPKNLLPYGTLQLRVNKRREFFQIRGLIDGIILASS